jgi:hypothetical protein
LHGVLGWEWRLRDTQISLGLPVLGFGLMGWLI